MIIDNDALFFFLILEQLKDIIMKHHEETIRAKVKCMRNRYKVLLINAKIMRNQYFSIFLHTQKKSLHFKIFAKQ